MQRYGTLTRFWDRPSRRHGTLKTDKDMRQKLVQDIVEREWAMFSAVVGADGPAGCQSDPASFAVMRKSQFSDWPSELLESYLADLKAAAVAGRNLMSEKYAWMMESTFPDEFAKIAGRLPAPDQAALALIEEIVAAHLEWKRELHERYPLLGGRGRALRAQDAGARETSFESYLAGELKTYSPRSIHLLHRHTAEQKNNGVNGAEVVLLSQARQQGYASLDEAEKALGNESPASACR